MTPLQSFSFQRLADRAGFARALRSLVAACLCLPGGALLAQTDAVPAPKPAANTASDPAATRVTSWGTGFVVGDGYLLTAHHVIQGQGSVLVGPLASGRWSLAEVVQSDAVLDLALLKARIDLPALSLAPSAEIPTGLEVSVIGYPQPRFQGLGKKITQGIVNGYRSEKQKARDVGLLQISAEVSKGNSGGPVLAPDGTVIGMVQRKIDAQKVAQQTSDLLINVNYALRSSQLIEFLRSGPVEPRVQRLALDTVLRPYQLFRNSEASVLAVIGRSAAAEASTALPLTPP